MIEHHFKIIWRNFLRDRQFSLLNLVGLSTCLRSIDLFMDK